MRPSMSRSLPPLASVSPACAYVYGDYQASVRLQQGEAGLASRGIGEGWYCCKLNSVLRHWSGTASRRNPGHLAEESKDAKRVGHLAAESTLFTWNGSQADNDALVHFSLSFQMGRFTLRIYLDFCIGKPRIKLDCNFNSVRKQKWHEVGSRRRPARSDLAWLSSPVGVVSAAWALAGVHYQGKSYRQMFTSSAGLYHSLLLLTSSAGFYPSLLLSC